MELIEKLKHHIKYHIRPYNLGDNGETETLIMELISKYEAAQQSVQLTAGIRPVFSIINSVKLYRSLWLLLARRN